MLWHLLKSTRVNYFSHWKIYQFMHSRINYAVNLCHRNRAQHRKQPRRINDRHERDQRSSFLQRKLAFLFRNAARYRKWMSLKYCWLRVIKAFGCHPENVRQVLMNKKRNPVRFDHRFARIMLSFVFFRLLRERSRDPVLRDGLDCSSPKPFSCWHDFYFI